MLSGVGIMIQELISDEFAIIVFDSGFSNRRAFEIFTKILNIVFHVGRGFLKVYNPCFTIRDL